MTPAEQLVGIKVHGQLLGGWNVLSKLTRGPTDTGGCNSICYLVEHESGREGFLKAIDFTKAHASHNTADMLKFLSDGYVFERDLCLRCQDKGLRRVAHAIDHGTVTVDETHPFKDFLKVSFLVLNRAHGDIRRYLDSLSSFDDAFILRALHNIASALSQPALSAT